VVLGRRRYDAGLDNFEALEAEDQAALIATFRHWADLQHGKRADESRINEEHDEPKILAVKAGKHRFTKFHAGNDVWIIHRYYPKGKKQLDKVGRAVIKTTILAISDYEARTKNGKYNERD